MTSSKTKTIKLLIADDHQILIDGLKSILASQDKYQVVGQALNGRVLLEEVAEQKPDIIVMDINMPEMDGIEATKQNKENHPNAKIIILSTYDDAKLVKEMIKRGVDGYLVKSSDAVEILKAIEEVAAGGYYYSNSIAQKALFKQSQKVTGETEYPYGVMPVSLSAREVEVLRLVAQEHTTAEIAKQLFISTNTVETHRKNLLNKLNVKNSIGLVKWAIKNQIIK